MPLLRAITMAILALFLLVPVVRADTATPLPVPTSAAVSTPIPSTPIPTPVPVVATAVPIAPEPAPTDDQQPVTVKQEQSTPVAAVTQPAVPESTVAAEDTPTPHAVEGPPRDGRSGPSTASSGSSPPPSTGPTVGVPNPVVSSGAELTPTPVAVPPDLTLQPSSAQAPAQLTCSGKTHPTAQPFLSSPYTGWTEVMSFVDHDRPDYSVDGTIVLANGLKATASDGMESDFFPAYWSPAIRQYINYDGHNGYDFAISYQPVLAAAAGTVEYAGWNDPDPYVGYGQMVLINHHNGYVTLYGHLSKLEVKTGQQVSAGQEIGISGSTGHSSGPHLHFSVFHDCHVTDPYGWTGDFRDPLLPFDGEHAAYLWLPGHDPLLLNPPPNWPTFPLGLHVTVPAAARRAIAHNHIPPTDRLLLLALPQPSHSGAISAAEALARSEAQITREASAVTPELDDLVAQGLLDSYQVIPGAAAIWVHGVASAGELESLDGVASLSGAEPHDVQAAQTGLQHAILIQMGAQQAPSLWPTGFRSSNNAWRPLVTVMERDALVAGVALPGKQVTVNLRHGGSVIASARVTGDSQTGGFVATLSDALGEPVPTHAGDVVVVRCAGHVVRLAAGPLSVDPSRTAIAGHVGGNGQIAVSSPGEHADAVSLSHSAFSLVPSYPLTAGKLVVASLTDGAGNTEAAASFVPGLIVTEGEETVVGWTHASRPYLSLVRGGHTLASMHLRPAADGSFTETLTRAGHGVTVLAGDVLLLGDPHRAHRLVVPPLGVRIRLNAADAVLSGPAHASISMRLTRVSRGTRTFRTLLDDHGRATVNLGRNRLLGGDTASVQYTLADGSRIEAAGDTGGVLWRPGSGELEGHAPPRVIVSARAYTGEHLVGKAAGLAGFDGSFHFGLGGAAPAAALRRADRLVLREGHTVISLTLPSLALTVHAKAARIVAPPHSTVELSLMLRTRHTSVRRIDVGSAGVRTVPLTGIRSINRAVVTWTGSGNVTVERVAIVRQHTASSH